MTCTICRILEHLEKVGCIGVKPVDTMRELYNQDVTNPVMTVWAYLYWSCDFLQNRHRSCYDEACVAAGRDVSVIPLHEMPFENDVDLVEYP